MRQLTIAIISAILLFSISLTQGYAQEFSSGVATYVQIDDEGVQRGSIVSFSSDGYKLSKVAYDPTSYAVVTSDPSVSLEDPEENAENSYPVITTGKAFVRVTTQNGPIEAGNLIASSQTPGVGQKATSDGYVIGTALEDYAESDTERIGSIYVSLNFGFNTESTQLRQNLLNKLQQSLVSPFVSPVNTLRYLIAGLAVLVGLTVGLLHFGRSTSSGIEAMGRNPLARNAIFLSMVMNLLLTLAAMGVGLGIAYFILVL